MRKIVSIFILLCFLVSGQLGICPVYAQSALSADRDFFLPAPGVMVHLSPPLDPPILKGIKVHPDNPFRFDFILDKGDEYNRHPDNYTRHPERSEGSQEQIKTEATKLIKYFLASLTIPENDLWVNLSPYEKNRIIPQSFGQTEMGRDLLAEDYMLKQITASLIYPEDMVGKKFWKRVYEQAAKKYGTTNIPVNTFNKVWIVPQKAVVYENAQAGTAYVVESKLKVMLEEDYLSIQKHNLPPLFHKEGVRGSSKNINSISSQIIREIVIPELTKEINEDKNFAKLRQVYNSLILATWYKKKIKDSILQQVYADKKKVAGVGYDQSIIPMKGKAFQRNASNDVELIYHRYLQAFKKGVYNYIKEDIDPATQEIIPRKYFSGGVQMLLPGFTDLAMSNFATKHQIEDTELPAPGSEVIVEAGVEQYKQTGETNTIPTQAAQEVQVTKSPEFMDQLIGEVQQEKGTGYSSDKIKQWIQPYMDNDLSDEQGLRRLLKHKLSQTSNPEINTLRTRRPEQTKEDTTEHEYFALTGAIASALMEKDKNEIVITTIGPGTEPGWVGELYEVTRNLIAHFYTHGLEKEFKVKFRFYEKDPKLLNRLESIFPERLRQFRSLTREYEGRGDKLKFEAEYYYGDLLDDAAREKMLLPSNIIIWRHTWALTHGMSLSDAHDFLASMKNKVMEAGGGMVIVRELAIEGGFPGLIHQEVIGFPDIKPIHMMETAEKAMVVNVTHVVKKGETVDSIIFGYSGIRKGFFLGDKNLRAANPWFDHLPSPGTEIKFQFPAAGHFLQKIYTLPVAESFEDIQEFLYGSGEYRLNNKLLEKGERAAALSGDLKRQYGLNQKIPASTRIILGFSQNEWNSLSIRKGLLIKGLKSPMVVNVTHVVKTGETVDSILFGYSGVHKISFDHIDFRADNPWFDHLPSPGMEIKIRFSMQAFMQKIYTLPIAQSFQDIEKEIYTVGGYDAKKGERAAALSGDLKRKYGLDGKISKGTEVLLGLTFAEWDALSRRGVPPGLADTAMKIVPVTKLAENRREGGINLTPANMDLQVRMDSRLPRLGGGFRGNDSRGDRNDRGISFHIDPAMLLQLQKSPGFEPVVFNILPLGDLRRFLSSKNESPASKSAIL